MKRILSAVLIGIVMLSMLVIAPISASAASYVTTPTKLSIPYYDTTGKAQKFVAKIPQINLSSTDATKANKIIKDFYTAENKKITAAYNKKTKFIPVLGYEANVYANIISIHVQSLNVSGKFYSGTILNLNAKTGKFVTADTILSTRNLTKDSAKKLALAAVKKDLASGKSFYQKTYAKYGKSYLNTVTSTEALNLVSYYLGANGNVMMAYNINWKHDGATLYYGLTASLTNYVAAPKMTKMENIDGGIKLTWDKVKGASKYRLYFKLSSGKWSKLIDTASTSGRVKGPASGKTYTFTLRALDSSGKVISDYNKNGFSITYIAPPAAPTLKNTKNGVQVNWKKVTGAAKYRVFRKTSGSKWTKLADTTSLQYVDKTAKSGTKYAYTVRCISKDSKQYTSACDMTGTTITCKR